MKMIILLAVSCLLTGCDMAQRIDQSTCDIERNTRAIERSTEAIHRNLEQMEKMGG